MITKMVDSLLGCLVLVFAAWFLICIVFAILSNSCVKAYLKIQKWLILHSHCGNRFFRGFNRKILVINYRVYRLLFALFNSLRVYEIENNRDYFSVRTVSQNGRRVLMQLLSCGAFAIFLYLGKRYWGEIYTFILSLDESELIVSIFQYVVNNWSTLLVICGIIMIAWSYYRDNYINKIILEIHDEELKKIIDAHKSAFRDRVKLRNKLCKNIETVLNAPKKNGKIVALYSSMERNFRGFKYDSEKGSFEPCDTWRYSDFSYAERYDDISGLVGKSIEDRLDASLYYRTSAVNKYVRGLGRFDILYGVYERDEKKLVCKEYILRNIDKVPEDLSKTVHSEISDDEKIHELNKYLNMKNDCIVTVIRETIQYIIELDDYLVKFNKAFRLRTRRKNFPHQEMLEKMDK